MIIATGVLGLMVTYQAHRQITVAAGRGATAIIDADSAYTALANANREVGQSFKDGNVALLLGPGPAYQADITTASQDLVLTAENNVAGTQGASKIQFAEGLLSNYTDKVGQAGIDAAIHGPAGVGPLARADLGDAQGILYSTVPCDPHRTPLCGQSRIWSVIDILHREQQAVRAGLSSRWLAPGDVRWLLLAPLLAMLVLAACMSYALRRGFQRILSVRLVAAVVLVLGLALLLAALNGHDRQRAITWSRPDLTVNVPIKVRLYGEVGRRALAEEADSGPAFSPWALAVALALAGGAGSLTYAAFRPRLEEYRYRP